MSKLNIAKAVRSNAVNAIHLQWLQHYPRILSTIEITSTPRSADVFIEKLAAWQDNSGGLVVDGILGPKTWGKLRKYLGSLAVITEIPNWLRTPVAQGWRQAIIHTLRMDTSFLRLRNMTHSIAPVDFIRLAELIEKDHITIVATRGRASASYEFRNEMADANSIKTPHRAGISWRYSQGLIVHEACHAISDVKGIKQPFLDEEITAYVVQQMFLQKFNVPLSSVNIHAAAAPLAKKYLKGKNPEKTEWEELKNMVRKYPFYAEKEQSFPFLKFDGV